MLRNKESEARIKLAGRLLVQMKSGDRQPILPNEIAQLRFLAESKEESEMPLDRLAQTIIERERNRMGIQFPEIGLGSSRRN